MIFDFLSNISNGNSFSEMKPIPNIKFLIQISFRNILFGKYIHLINLLITIAFTLFYSQKNLTLFA